MTSDREDVPSGEVQFAWFGGILEGQAADLERLGSTVQEINGLGMVVADLDAERGRFSILFDNVVVSASTMNRDKSERLVELLDRIVHLSSTPERLESTLNCTEVYSDGVVETLFAVRDGAIDAVSRRREVRPADLAKQNVGAPAPSIAVPNMGRPMIVALLALLMVAGGLMAWRNGLVDQIMAAQVETLQVDQTSFEGLLAVKVDGTWGIYEVSISRGPKYPETAAEATALEGGEITTADLAAIRTVAGGSKVYVQLLDKDSKVLEAEPVSLAGLLSKDEPVLAKLRGRARAKSIRLALDSGFSKQ